MPTPAGNITLPQIESSLEKSLYILIPLGLLLVIIILSLLVCLMASKRRRVVHTNCRKRQTRLTLIEQDKYNSLEHCNDTEEDEIDSEDDPAKSLLRGRLQINNPFENYLATSQLNRTSELST